MSLFATALDDRAIAHTALHGINLDPNPASFNVIIADEKHWLRMALKPMLRGFVRENRSFPVSKQKAVLIAAGVPERAIYENELAAAIKSLRKDDMLAVAGLRSLGTSRREIISALDKVHNAGKCVIDAATGRKSDGRYAVNLMAEAVSDLANERRGENLKSIARLGAAASAKVRTAGRMPLDMASIFWFDKRLRNNEAVEQINGHPDYRKPYSPGTLYRKLGPREVVAGRPSAERAAKLKTQYEREKFRRGSVYFIREHGTDRMKIGFSTQPHDRILALQTSSGARLELFAVIEGTMADEKALHERFARFRVRGEWFRIRGQFKEYLRALPRYENTN